MNLIQQNRLDLHKASETDGTQSKEKITWFLREIANWPLLLVLFVSFFVVYLLPHIQFNKSEIWSSYVAWLLASFPGLKKYCEVSAIKEIAYVYYPLMFLISPIAVLEVLLKPVRSDRWFDFPRNKPFVNFLRLVLILLLCILGARVTLFVGGYQFESLPVNSSEFYLALLGHFGAGTAFWALLGLFFRGFYSFIFRR